MEKLKVDIIKLSDTQAVIRTNGDKVTINEGDKFFYQTAGSLDCVNDKFDVGTEDKWKILNHGCWQDKDGNKEIDVYIMKVIKEVERYNAENQEDIKITRFNVIRAE